VEVIHSGPHLSYFDTTRKKIVVGWSSSTSLRVLELTAAVYLEHAVGRDLVHNGNSELPRILGRRFDIRWVRQNSILPCRGQEHLRLTVGCPVNSENTRPPQDKIMSHRTSLARSHKIPRYDLIR